jgi:hypothetical protein
MCSFRKLYVGEFLDCAVWIWRVIIAASNSDNSLSPGGTAMKRWLSRLAIVFALFVGVVGSPATLLGGQSTAAKQDPQSITVFVTRTGAKYHRDGCRYLSRSRIPMSLNEAARRFEPCKVCKPPVLR